MRSIELTAPAKVNLFLKVLSKRKDSYHDLLTVFERISLSDQIKISKIPAGIVVTCDKPITPRQQDNIAYKAAELILRTAKIKSGVKIHIKKRIPIAAGLGGGSSDAAAVLIGINKLLDLNMDKNKLMRLGAKLGADVPFFIFDTPFAVGRGIGDRLEKINLKTKFYHILIYPGFMVATKDVYRAFDASKRLSKSLSPRQSSGSSAWPLPKHLTNRRGGDKMTLPRSWNGLEGFLYNDLESVVADKRPIIGKIIRCLVSSPGKRAMVSGSGPSVFCLYRTRREAIEAKKKLLNSVPVHIRGRWQMFIVETRI